MSPFSLCLLKLRPLKPRPSKTESSQSEPVLSSSTAAVCPDSDPAQSAHPLPTSAPSSEVLPSLTSVLEKSYGRTRYPDLLCDGAGNPLFAFPYALSITKLPPGMGSYLRSSNWKIFLTARSPDWDSFPLPPGLSDQGNPLDATSACIAQGHIQPPRPVEPPVYPLIVGLRTQKVKYSAHMDSLSAPSPSNLPSPPSSPLVKLATITNTIDPPLSLENRHADEGLGSSPPQEQTQPFPEYLSSQPSVNLDEGWDALHRQIGMLITSTKRSLDRHRMPPPPLPLCKPSRRGEEAIEPSYQSATETSSDPGPVTPGIPSAEWTVKATSVESFIQPNSSNPSSTPIVPQICLDEAGLPIVDRNPLILTVPIVNYSDERATNTAQPPAQQPALDPAATAAAGSQFISPDLRGASPSLASIENVVAGRDGDPQQPQWTRDADCCVPAGVASVLAAQQECDEPIFPVVSPRGERLDDPSGSQIVNYHHIPSEGELDPIFPVLMPGAARLGDLIDTEGERWPLECFVDEVVDGEVEGQAMLLGDLGVGRRGPVMFNVEAELQGFVMFEDLGETGEGQAMGD